MDILAVTASDPAIRVGLREESVTATYVVTATIPPGYSIVGKDHEEIVVRTDSAGEPVRIPVRAWSGTLPPPHVGWLTAPKRLIGQSPPAMKLVSREGAPIEYTAVPGEVCVLMFVADWCGHCDTKVPILERVRSEYADRQIPNLRFLAVCPAAGSSNKKAEEAIERWDLGGLIGLDKDMAAIRRYGVKAYPVVFLVGLDGTVQAVHGRYSNTEDHNGLDTLESDLHTEIDILLAGGTRAYFPAPAPATRPAQFDPPPLPDHPILRTSIMPRTRSQHASDSAMKCRAGATAVFKTIIHNDGGRAVNIRAMVPAEGVKVRSGYVNEVPVGGMVVLACEVTAPNSPGAFSRQLKIETDDPQHPHSEISLKGVVIESETQTAKAQHAQATTRPSRSG